MSDFFDQFKTENVNTGDKAASQENKTASDGTVYGDLKNLENQFPIPTPEETVLVGTLNSLTGSFDAAVSIPTSFPTSSPIFNTALHSELGISSEISSATELIISNLSANSLPLLDDLVSAPELDDPILPPQPTEPLVEINAVNAILEFRVKVPSDPLSMTANGITVTAPAGENSVLVNVGKATVVSWTFTSGNLTFSDKLIIRRPRIIGAGAFTIPALPIGIVYDPPVDQEKKNVASNSSTNIIGVSTSNSFSNDTSNTTGVSSRYKPITDLQAAMAVSVKVFEKIPDASGKIIANGLKLFSEALGKASSLQTVGTKITETSSLDITLADSKVFNADTHQGPGLGDRIIYLKDVQLVWLAENGHVSLSILDHDSLSAPTIKILKEDLAGQSNTTGLDSDTIEALLELNPFSSNPQSNLPTQRFELLETYNITEGSQAITFEHTTKSVDQQASTEYNVRVDDHRKGFLAFLGIGVTKTEKVKTDIRIGQSTALSQTQKTKSEVKFNAQPGEHYSVEVYYDKIFNSFAFREVPDSSQPFLVGELTDTSGKALVGEVVTLAQAGRTFTTVSDAQGKYAFFTSTIAAGTAILGSKGSQKTITLGPSALNADLQIG